MKCIVMLCNTEENGKVITSIDGQYDISTICNLSDDVPQLLAIRGRSDRGLWKIDSNTCREKSVQWLHDQKIATTWDSHQNICSTRHYYSHSVPVLVLDGR